MEVTINIKGQKNITSFLNLIRKYDYIEIIDVKEDISDMPYEHKILLDERLGKLEDGKVLFKSWDSIKKKYEGKIV
jgi:hypothetical protein